MKYIKLFEELDPKTYKSAAEKLKKLGHLKRSDGLTNYLNSFETKYNLNLFYSEELDGSDHDKKIQVECIFDHTNIYYGDEDHGNVERFVSDNLQNFSDSYIIIDFYFKISSNDVKKYGLASDVVNTFSIGLNLYKNNDDISNKDFKIEIYLEPGLDFSKVFSDSDPKYLQMGLFSDKRSAYSFKKKLSSVLLDDIKMNDIISFYDGLSEHYERYMKSIRDINTNLLISEVVDQDTRYLN